MRERSVFLAWWLSIVASCVATGLDAQTTTAPSSNGSRVVFNDAHFHLTNYVQRGIALPEFLRMMGDSVGRVALFGIPLQQEWLYNVSGARAPTYYLNTDAPLYYYSFTDAVIAT